MNNQLILTITIHIENMVVHIISTINKDLSEITLDTNDDGIRPVLNENKRKCRAFMS